MKPFVAFVVSVTLILLIAAVFSPNVNVSAQTPPPLWQQITPNFTDPGVYAATIAVDPAHPGTVYIGTSEADFTGEGIWKSTDYGSTFTRVDQPFSVNGPCVADTLAHLNLALKVDDIGYVYATNNYGCAAGIFRSTDGGVHWSEVCCSNKDMGHIEVDPYLAGHIIASTHGDHTCECGGPDQESFDHGTTWRETNRVPNVGHNNWVHFLNNSNTWAQGTPNGLFRTTDSGLTWTQVSGEIAGHGGQNMIRVGNRFYTVSTSGVLFSDDNGLTWTLVTAVDQNPDDVLAIGYDGTSRLFTRTANVPGTPLAPAPMLVSTNGTSWAPYNSQLFIDGPMDFARDSQYLYAAMVNGGLWRLPLAGGPPATATPTVTPVVTNTPVPPTATRTPTTVPPSPTGTPVPPTSTPTPVSAICNEAYWKTLPGGTPTLMVGPVRSCP